MSSANDIVVLQNDINIVFEWCKLNDMSFNIDKCWFIRFSRIKLTIPAQYFINNVALGEVFVVKDLGVYLDTRLTFTNHFEIFIAKANKMLGFIKRTSKDFKNVQAVKTLYVSLVRSIMEFSNIISPHLTIRST